ncbi:MAG: substrate-binding domain-containing protein [Hespellia sp.]|nr:substrate-binding domain-containing protein [Hespellia sp.]
MKKRLLGSILAFVLAFGLLTGCGGQSGDSGSKDSGKDAGAETEAQPDGDLPVVGISTGSSGTVFRDEMTQALVEVGDEYKADGRIADYKIVDNATNGDATEQANIIRDFISDGVDIILLNPNSSDALNGVIKEAQDAGILVLSYDGTCTAEDVITVQVSPYQWNYDLVTYITDNVSSGTAIDIYGLDGHPGNIQRLQARDDVLENYPDINIVAETSGGWDETVAKEATAQILASGVKPDIVFTQDSCAYGVLSALMEQDVLPKAMVGEPSVAYFKLWKQLRDENADFISCAEPNPPGISGTGFRVAENLYEGKEFKDDALQMVNDANTFYYEVSGFYTDENFDEAWELLKDQPDDYMLTEYISEEDLQGYFK